jgi:iron complex outermembrane receptor protein
MNVSPVWRTLGASLWAWMAVNIAAATAVPAQEPAGLGTIEGRVFNRSSQSYLNHALVSVVGTNQQGLTNQDGEFRIPRVAAGEVLVRVDYAGLPAQTSTVRVVAGQPTQLNFELAPPSTAETPVEMERFVIEATQLSAQASALNEQRQAPNIKHVVALEEFGDLADGNVGEYLKYTPGLAVTFGPQVAGSVSIRGMPASGTLVMLDGAEISSPGADRSFDLTSSAAGAIDRVEVTKVPTPDLPANAVGGSINIVARSGFSLPRASLKTSAFLTYNSLEGVAPPGWGERNASDPGTNVRKIQPGFDFAYVRPVNKSLAFTLNAGRSERFYGMEFDLPTWDLVRGVQTTTRYQAVQQTIERVLYAGTVDWRINRDNSVRLNVQHIQQNANTRQHDFYAIFGANATGDAAFTQGAAAGVDTIRHTPTWGDRTKGTTLGTLRFAHLGPVWRIDFNATVSSSWDERKDLEKGYFRTLGSAQLGNLVVRAEGLDQIADRRAARITARDRTGRPVAVYDSDELSLGSVVSQPNRIESDMQQATVQVSRDFSGRIPLSIKTGGSINRQVKDSRSIARTWTFAPPGGAAGRQTRNFDFVNEGLSAQRFWNETLQVEWLSPLKVHSLYREHPEYFTLNESTAHISQVNNSTRLEERVTAGFLRFDSKLLDNRLWLVAGVRYERTDDQGSGPLNDLRATFQQDASGNLIRNAAGRPVPITTNPLENARLQYRERGAASRRNYDGYHPSVNLSYSFSESMVARAACARTIGRPELSEIIPGITVTDPDSTAQNRTITVVNTGLTPWTADNFDLSLEAYNVRGAVVSASVFQKNISDFFGVTRVPATAAFLAQYGLSDDYLDYEIVTKRNFGGARVSGVELSWRQSLFFLPGWARGFQVFANATRMNLSGSNAADFSPFTGETMNWGVHYLRRGLSVKLNVAYSGEVTGARVATSATVPAETFQYIAPKTTVDLSADVNVFKRLTLFGSIRNLNGSPKRTLRAAPGTPDHLRPVNYQNFGALITVGLRGAF